MFEILVGSQRSQFRYAKKAGEQQLSGFRVSHAKACARPTLSLRTVNAEHTLQGVDANSVSLSSSFTIAHVSARSS